MIVGLDAVPTARKPPVESISIFERPELLFQAEPLVADLPKYSFFCAEASFEAANVMKFKLTPAATVAAGLSVKLTGLELKPQLPPAAQTKDAFRMPEEDPVIVQWLASVAAMVMSSFKASASAVTTPVTV